MAKTLSEFAHLYATQKILVFDTETTLINKDKSIYTDTPEFILGSMFTPNMRGNKPVAMIHTKFLEEFLKKSLPRIVVGHNLAFDMLQCGWNHYDIPTHHFWWDTAIFEYEISGQESTFPSLQDLADKYYPGEKKDETVSEMIKAGVSPKDIPTALLQAYCDQDVALTSKIFHAQIDEFFTLNTAQKNLIMERMQFKVNTHLMSMSGMFMDKKMIEDGITQLEIEIIDLHGFIHDEMQGHMPYANEWNPASNQQIALCIYGGEYSYTLDVVKGTYKTGPKAGQPKYQKTPCSAKVLSPVYPAAAPASVDEATLKEINKLKPSVLIDKILEYRNLCKELGTYFKGYMESGKIIGETVIVACEYKHTITPTGRISSVKPNLQNLKRD